MSDVTRDAEEPGPESASFYLRALADAGASGIPFLLGGAYAFANYTGIARDTKDLDLFVRPADAPRLLDALAAAGYHTEVTFPHWLGKAFQGDNVVDVIYSSGNGACPVDDGWFAHARPGKVLGIRVRLIPPEEMIWQKAYIMERERFDGADVAHLIRARGPTLDWGRLLRRFGSHWRVLFAHLVLFEFIYPAEQAKVPAEVLREVTGRLAAESEAPAGAEAVCRGPLLSRMQYLADTECWGYHDPRLVPEGGTMSRADVTHWTAAAFEQK
jgi:hypothetical protein